MPQGHGYDNKEEGRKVGALRNFPTFDPADSDTLVGTGKAGGEVTWNHRVIVRKDGRDQQYYGIHEVYYKKNNKPDMATENAVGVIGDSIPELRETLERMLRALDTPVLRWKGKKLVEMK